jgi:hypothetical protein
MTLSENRSTLFGVMCINNSSINPKIYGEPFIKAAHLG